MTWSGKCQAVAEHNRKAFEQTGIINYYDTLTELTAAEQQILLHCRDNYSGKRVLDLGVGTGRTTLALATLAESYVGLDFSAGMIERCRQRFPEYRFEHGDARDLSRFPAGSMDFVLFSFNGIDLVDHNDRERILQQVHHVLARDGIFAFSAHNLAWLKARTSSPQPDAPASPKRKMPSARRMVRLSYGAMNYLRYRGMQRQGQAYAILLDKGHDYTVPVYYVSDAEQRRQLTEAGYHGAVSVVPEYGWDHGCSLPEPSAQYYVAMRNS